MDIMFSREHLRSLRDRWVMGRIEYGETIPLILHETCYSYIGQPVKIIEANVFDEVKNAEVVIETGFGDRTQVEFSELLWHYCRTTIDAACKTPRSFYIRDGLVQN